MKEPILTQTCEFWRIDVSARGSDRCSYDPSWSFSERIEYFVDLISKPGPYLCSNWELTSLSTRSYMWGRVLINHYQYVFPACKVNKSARTLRYVGAFKLRQVLTICISRQSHIGVSNSLHPRCMHTLRRECQNRDAMGNEIWHSNADTRPSAPTTLPLIYHPRNIFVHLFRRSEVSRSIINHLFLASVPTPSCRSALTNA